MSNRQPQFMVKSSNVLAENLDVLNPKRYQDVRGSEDKKIFPYYAGYSMSFADSLLRSMRLDPRAVLLDPWNGSGTSTLVAATQGIKGMGLDLNPAMVIVAKAGLVSRLDIDSLQPLGNAITVHANDDAGIFSNGLDPLEQWFAPSSARRIRAISNEIYRSLLNDDLAPKPRELKLIATRATPLAAFFYVALFRMARRLLLEFIPSNPTWVKKPEAFNRRKIPSADKIHTIFLDEITQLVDMLRARASDFSEQAEVDLRVGNAEFMNIDAASVDAVISSPPYCTRIDYAVATSIELAVMGCSMDEYDTLRRSLTGTSTVPKVAPQPQDVWGKTCSIFLDRVATHNSKASKSYYLKNHVQYFASLSKSISEIGRVLRPAGRAVLVVQDSYYKDIFNDVPTIVAEMAYQHGLRLERRDDFLCDRSMARINKASKKYGVNRPTTESVLCFRPV